MQNVNTMDAQHCVSHFCNLFNGLLNLFFALNIHIFHWSSTILPLFFPPFLFIIYTFSLDIHVCTA